MSNSELPRIDRYTCRFENPVMEDQHMSEKWSRIRKGLNFGLGFISLVIAWKRSFWIFPPAIFVHGCG